MNGIIRGLTVVKANNSDAIRQNGRQYDRNGSIVRTSGG